MTAKTEFINHNFRRKGTPLVATIGFFDGVHRGHRFLIEKVIATAEAAGMASATITLDRHPSEILRPDSPTPLLSKLENKIKLLEQAGTDHVFVLHFNKELAALSAKAFMQRVLKEQLNVQKLIIGYDNKFGNNPKEDFDNYAAYGKELGIEVIKCPEFTDDGMHICSSVIRKLITTGQIEAANKALGYEYTLRGKVVPGFQNGRKLGFPTANMGLNDNLSVIPKNGVYAVKIFIEGHDKPYFGMTNIGIRPTFHGKFVSIESNIFNFKEDIYGKNIGINFVKYIREEKKFDGLEELKQQLKADQQAIKHYFDTHIEKD